MFDFLLPESALKPFLNLNETEKITSALLNQFLDDTQHLELEASERLRYLTINLEDKDFANGWLNQKCIYDASIAANPKNIRAYESLIASALSCLELEYKASFINHFEIAELAEQEIKQALTLFPKEAGLSYIYGLLLYKYPTKVRTREALEQFRQAHALAPSHQMAALYKAHCLQDLERWQEAFEAYLSVNEKDFLASYPVWRWRMLKMQEQKALCAAKAGETNLAKQILKAYFIALNGLATEVLNEEITNLDDSVYLLTELWNEPEMLNTLKVILKRANLLERYQW